MDLGSGQVANVANVANPSYRVDSLFDAYTARFLDGVDRFGAVVQ